MTTKFRNTILAAMFAMGLLVTSAAFIHSANAAALVCEAGSYWDAFPVWRDALGNCVTRLGDSGFMGWIY
jgi:hypothetical protein